MDGLKLIFWIGVIIVCTIGLFVTTISLVAAIITAGPCLVPLALIITVVLITVVGAITNLKS